jgi:23S rRNA pseudouridine2605 synthase
LDERLHKLLAQHGIGSRRQVEAWIRDGRVLVNGKPAEIGQHVRPGDRVVVDGRDVSKRLAARPALRVIAYHKPSGEMSRSREGDDRAGVEERLPSLRAGRWLPVNALAFGEDGLLILSNDGTLASAISRNAASLPVEYRVRVLRPREDEGWPELPLAIEVEGEPVRFAAVERLEGAGTNVWFRVIADRPVRRGALRALFDGAGLKLSRVMLVKWGPVALPRDLPRGRSRELTGPDLDGLLALAGRVQTREAGPRRPARGRKPKGARTAGRSAKRTTGPRSGDR